MSLLSPSTNADYRGAKVSAWFLMLAAISELIAGCIHYFLPDGGAGVIAGMDLSTRRQTIITMFAWYGSMQIPYALFLFVIGLRYRTLVPLALLSLIISRALVSVDAWFGKGAQGGHHPPEHFVSPVAVAVGSVFLLLALTKRHRTN